jgi:hypothetical protein
LLIGHIKMMNNSSGQAEEEDDEQHAAEEQQQAPSSSTTNHYGNGSTTTTTTSQDDESPLRSRRQVVSMLVDEEFMIAKLQARIPYGNYDRVTPGDSNTSAPQPPTVPPANNTDNEDDDDDDDEYSSEDDEDSFEEDDEDCFEEQRKSTQALVVDMLIPDTDETDEKAKYRRDNNNSNKNNGRKRYSLPKKKQRSSRRKTHTSNVNEEESGGGGALERLEILENDLVGKQVTDSLGGGGGGATSLLELDNLENSILSNKHVTVTHEAPVAGAVRVRGPEHLPDAHDDDYHNTTLDNHDDIETQPKGHLTNHPAPERKNIHNIDDDDSQLLAVANPVPEVETVTVAVHEDAIKDKTLQNRRRTYTKGLAWGCCVLVVIVVVVIATQLTRSGDTTEVTATPTVAPTSYRETLGIQEELALALGKSQEEDESWHDDPVHQQALDWIINQDPLQLDPFTTDSKRLLQRYVMAYFYYHTSQQGPWIACNPPKLEKNEHDFCLHKILKVVSKNEKWYEALEPAEFQYDSFQSFRWLSSVGECQWAGVTCNEDGYVIRIKLGKYQKQDNG